MTKIQECFTQTSIKEVDERQNRSSDTTNDTQLVRLSDYIVEELELEENTISEKNSFIHEIILENIKRSQISPSLNKKAVNWLITLCWTRNYSIETLWNAIGYYYAYTSKTSLVKEKLSVLLITIVNLALKMFQPQKALKLEEMKSIVSKVEDKTDFLQLQEEVVGVLQFDLYFSSNLATIYAEGGHEETTEKLLFLCEVLFLSTFEPAISTEYLEQLFSLVNEPQTQNIARLQIKKLSKEQKHIQTIKLKYSSKFDVDQFWRSVIA